MENHLLLNLLGKRFHLPSRLVADYPQTLLGNQSLLAKYYRQYANEYYLERNPLLFPYILTYYTLEKKIFCPHHIPIELLENECQFFQLSNASIYRERNRTATYQYFPRRRHRRHERWIELASFVAGILFMVAISTETVRRAETSWSVASVMELLGTFLLTSSILSRIIFTRSDSRDLCRKKSFLFDVFSSLVSVTLIAIETFASPTDSRLLPLAVMICKTVRLLMMIGHLRILRLVWLTCLHRLQTVCTLLLINILITGSLGEIAFAFERRQYEEQQIAQSTMKTHLDALWWATSLSFTIGFGHTDPHWTLTTTGRFCSYSLIFFGLLFNGLILQELIKEFTKISSSSSAERGTEFNSARV